jgi:thiol:disulfide interchange protein DsbD
MAFLSVVVMVSGVVKPNEFNRWIVAGHTTESFIVVHDMDELNKQIASASASNKPVLLDFYADWCESCVAMDKKVFSAPDVQQVLNHFVLLRADLTANNKADQTILKNFDVVAPPTILFFNNQGREVNLHRIVGEVNEKEFMTRLNTFITARCDKKIEC